MKFVCLYFVLNCLFDLRNERDVVSQKWCYCDYILIQIHSFEVLPEISSTVLPTKFVTFI